LNSKELEVNILVVGKTASGGQHRKVIDKCVCLLVNIVEDKVFGAFFVHGLVAGNNLGGPYVIAFIGDNLFPVVLY
jgi:hypothetical protein